ncbi:hypothetical protein N9V64_02305 [Candidatus Pelagibacter bacterium]|nr:hypothetical protein [Candidatus Pelagibacter bacterium]
MKKLLSIIVLGMQRMADQFEIIKGHKYGTYIYRDGKDKNGEDIC